MPISIGLLTDANNNQLLTNSANTSVTANVPGLFGKYFNNTIGSSNASTVQLNALNSIWTSYINALYPELTTASSFDSSGQSINFLDSKDNLNIFLGYMFESSLRSFFYDWLPSKNISALSNLGSSSSAAATALGNLFVQYLNDGTASLSGKRQNFSGMWVILMLIQIMQQMQNTAPNKASTALIYAQGEEAAAQAGALVTFYQQSSANDYATQQKNQNNQQKAQSYQNWRTIIGQSTSNYQTQTQTSNDSYSQMQQLISSILEQFQNMLQFIIK